MKSRFLSIITLSILFVWALSCKKADDPIPAPTVTSISPTIAPYGAVVTITGTNFGATVTDNVVKINGKAVVVKTSTATQITVEIPKGLGTGDVTITANAQTTKGPKFMYDLTPKTVTTLAGGTGGDRNGVGTSAQFFLPQCIVIDASGTIFITDNGNDKIKKITSDGVVSTFAGTTTGYADGSITTAKFSGLLGILIDPSGNMIVSEVKRIRKITSSGVVSTIAGDGTYGNKDGIGTAAQFYNPFNIALDSLGNIIAVDSGNHRIRKITSAGVVSTLAGNARGYADGTGTAALFFAPAGIVMDSKWNILATDRGNNRIRKITPAGVVTTFAGSTYGDVDGQSTVAKFGSPTGIAIDAVGNIIMIDSDNNKIKKISPSGVVSTLAGGKYGTTDGLPKDAAFQYPESLAIDAKGNIIIADTFGNRIRKIEME